MDTIAEAREKLLRIAKSILKDEYSKEFAHRNAFSRRVSFVMPVKTDEGVKEFKVKKFTIIVTDVDPIRIGSKEIYAKSTKRNEPCYPLEKVKECLNQVPDHVKFDLRKDHKNDPFVLNLNTDNAKEIIKNLNRSDYSETVENFEPYADVYKPEVELEGAGKTKLYIKLYLSKDEEMLGIVSFHKEGMFPKK